PWRPALDAQPPGRRAGLPRRLPRPAPGPGTPPARAAPGRPLRARKRRAAAPDRGGRGVVRPGRGDAPAGRWEGRGAPGRRARGVVGDRRPDPEGREWRPALAGPAAAALRDPRPPPRRGGRRELLSQPDRDQGDRPGRLRPDRGRPLPRPP